KEHESAHGRPGPEDAGEQESRDKTEAELERRRAGRVDSALPQAIPELRIANEARVVAEANPPLGGKERVLVEEGQPDRVANGIEDQDADQDESGQDSEQAEARRRLPSARHATSSDIRPAPAALRRASAPWRRPRLKACP